MPDNYSWYGAGTAETTGGDGVDGDMVDMRASTHSCDVTVRSYTVCADGGGSDEDGV